MPDKNDPLDNSALADALVQRTAARLRELLQDLVNSIGPFPSFMGVSSLHAVEIDLPDIANTDRGCIVVCPDAELYELTLHLIHGPDEYQDVDHIDVLTELDLSPAQYISYAHGAIGSLSAILIKQIRDKHSK